MNSDSTSEVLGMIANWKDKLQRQLGKLRDQRNAVDKEILEIEVVIKEVDELRSLAEIVGAAPTSSSSQGALRALKRCLRWNPFTLQE